MVELLPQILLVEAVAAAAVVLAILTHAVVLLRRRHRRRPQIARGRELLMTVLERPLPPADVQWLRALPFGVQLQLFEELVVNLSGADLLRLQEAALAVDVAQHAARQCSSRRWWRRLRGVRAYTLLGGGDDVVPPLLADRSAAVRTQAAAWAAGHPDPAVVTRLFALLESGDRAVRFAVIDSLVRLGGASIRGLIAHLESAKGGIADGLVVARHLGDPLLVPVVRRHLYSWSPDVRRAAASALATMGGDVSVAILRSVLRDDDPQVRAAAIEGLGRAGHWMAAPQVAAALHDDDFEVRRRAAITLRSFGAPGTLFLRSAADSADTDAAGIARHVLELPTTVSAASSYL